MRSKLSSSSAEGWGEGRGTQKLGSSTSIVSTSAPLDQHRVRVKIPPTFFNPELGFNWNVAVALGNKQLNTEQMSTAQKPNTVSPKSRAQRETEEYLSRIRLKEIFQVDRIITDRMIISLS